ncbi:MAG: transaldolase [Myxococcales bacterium]|jgi:transaldolase|nr:transaldolase [Myxococcales bacterium]
MANLLEKLKEMTVVVADTGDFQSIEKFRPRDATTNPSLITAAAKMPAYASLIDDAIAYCKADGGTPEEIAKRAIDRLAVVFGLKILGVIPGRVSTEVDARLSFDTQGTVDKARAIIAQYAAQGVSKERILIKIASTWEGIKAAEILEKEGVHCNLTLLFGIHQAIACADAKATLISPFVGRILDWYKKSTGKASYAPHEDPGVVSVTRIFEYYKKHGHRTEVMGASFRNMGEITELAGCDLLTISPQLLAELEAAEGELPRKLDADRAKTLDIPKVDMTEETFRKMHAADTMANEKLAEGIEGFSKALVELETLLAARVRALG